MGAGGEGVLYISGPSVFAGYWNRPEETAAAFLERDGIRWYNTGDVVRFDPAEGFIYVGRRDRMVKRRGYRIELGEIESALYAHPRLREAAVVSMPDADAGVRVIAFVSSDAGRPPSIIELKTFCATKVPAYMSPDRFVFRDGCRGRRATRSTTRRCSRPCERREPSVSDPTSARLDYAERWLLDGLHVLRPPFSALQVTADMTHATRRLEELRREGVHATATHLWCRRRRERWRPTPRSHQLIAGTRRHRPATVDIGLSVTGDTFVAPVLVIESANTKSIAGNRGGNRAPRAGSAGGRPSDAGAAARWGWIVPFAFLRRAILRLLFRSGAFRRKGAGTFQISTVAGDWALHVDVCDVRRADRRADLVAGRGGGRGSRWSGR